MHWLLGGYMWLYIHRPFEVWPQLGNYRIERIYMILTIVAWCASGGKELIGNRLNRAYLAFVGAMVMAWLASPWGAEGTKTVEDYLKVAVFYVLMMTTVRKEEDLRKIVMMYVGAVGLYLTHSLMEYLNGRHVYRMGISRMVGVDSSFGDPNTFAATILYSLPFILPFAFKARHWWEKVGAVGFYGLSSVCVVLTGSRGGFVGLGVMTLAMAMFTRHRFKIVAVAALSAPLIWNAIPPEKQNRFLTLIDPSYGPKNALESAEGRAKGWQDGVQMWRDRPVFGVGPGAFAIARGYNLQSHHLYGQILGEIGTVGAIAFSMIVIGFLANAGELRRQVRAKPAWQKSFPHYVSIAVTLSVLMLLFQGFGGHNLFRYSWMWFGAFQAIALACIKRQEGPADADWSQYDGEEADTFDGRYASPINGEVWGTWAQPNLDYAANGQGGFNDVVQAVPEGEPEHELSSASPGVRPPHWIRQR